MRNTGVILAVTLTVALVATVLFFSFVPTTNILAEAAAASDTAATEAVANDPATMALYVERALTLQNQANELQRTIESRQATFAEQLTTLATAQSAAEEKLAILAQQEELLRGQLEEFTAARATRNAQYAQQIQDAQAQYAARAQAITAQINEAQARLNEANQMLGR
ncbi:MAG: hypothetical protein KDE20_19365 [Caldilineaceae bacterium]|nr:hypothetical protein [Caldilineaceae bacterium]